MVSFLLGNFDHDPAQLERFRQVLVETVNEGMKKRGLGKVSFFKTVCSYNNHLSISSNKWKKLL